MFVLFRRKLLISSLFIFTLFAFAFGTFLVSPVWKATAKLLVLQNPKQQMILFKDLTLPSPIEKETSATDLVEILRSNAFGVEIVKRYGLDEIKRQKAQNPKKMRDKIKLFLVKVFKSPFTLATRIGLLEEGSPNFFADALEEFHEDMKDIEREEGTSTINLSIWAESPELAIGIANTLASMLIDKTRQFERSEAAQTYDFARVHLQSVNAALEKAEDELRAFKEGESVVDLEMQRSLKLQRLDLLTAEFDANEKNLVAMEAKLKELRNQLSSQPERITISEVTGNNETFGTLENDLNKAELELANVQGSLGQKHPEIVGLKARIELSRQKLGEEQQRILLNETTAFNPLYQDLQRQIIDVQASIKELSAKRSSLQKALAGLGNELDSVPRKEIALERLARSVSGLKDRYVNLRSKLLELEIQKFTEVSEFDVKISDPAFIPDGVKPNRPIWWLNLLVGAISGLFLGIGLAFFREYWSDSLNTPVDVEEVAGLRVLGTVSKISLEKEIEHGRS